jgi:hypothetical protein
MCSNPRCYDGKVSVNEGEALAPCVECNKTNSLEKPHQVVKTKKERPMTEENTQRREIRFHAKFAAVLDQFKATNDVRHYLNGVFVSPHPDNGIILAASDGHTMVIIHDPDGSCDSEQIFPLTKPLVSASKKRFKILGKPAVVELIGDTAFVRTFRPENFDPEISFNDTHVEHNKSIEGKYPHLQNVIPKGEPVPSLIAFNSSYCARIEKACAALGHSKWPSSVWYTYGESSSMIVDLPIKEDVKIIIMPMKADIKKGQVLSDSMLAWVKSKEEEKTDV